MPVPIMTPHRRCSRGHGGFSLLAVPALESRPVPDAKAPLASPSPLRLIVVIDGTNLKGALDSRQISTHINYRQLAIEIAKKIPVGHFTERWALERVVYVTASPIQSHNRERFERWRHFEAMIRRQERVQLKLGRL